MAMPGRKYSVGDQYRYGFNGQEKTPEIFEGSTTALFWEYDSRIGRRWNLDPRFNACESRYLVNGVNPIIYTDPLGDFKTKFGAQWNKFWNGGKSVGKNEYDEWFVTRVVTGKEGKKGNGKDVLDEVVIGVERYYGKGRNKYSTAAEDLIQQEEIKQDIFLKGEKSIYQMYNSEHEAGLAALSLGTGLLMPEALIRPITIANASQKIVNSPVGKTVAEFVSSFKPIDPLDLTKTLYRGTTGSEAGSTVLFLTDNAAVAATYVKNGGQVMSYEMTYFSLRTLEFSGELRMATGMHGKVGVVNTEYIFQGKNLVEAINSIARPK